LQEEKRSPAHLEDVSVQATEKWLEDLLADPKVRFRLWISTTALT